MIESENEAPDDTELKNKADKALGRRQLCAVLKKNAISKKRNKVGKPYIMRACN